MRSEGYSSCRVCMYVCVYVRMYVCVCMCVCVTTHNCRLTHWNHKTEIPMCSQQYSDRFKFLPIFLKMLRSKVMAEYAYLEQLRRPRPFFPTE